MNNIKVSIIVPVYNTQKHLRKCIDSIIAQKHTEIELILINDGSTDSSGIICNDYAEKYSFIMALHTHNKGVSAARNLGLKKAQGEFVCFIDSDDYVSPSYILDLVDSLFTNKERNALIIHNVSVTNTKSIINDRNIDNKIVIGSDNIINEYVKNDLMQYSGPVSKLYNKSLLVHNNIIFPEGINMAEDAIFILRYLMHINTLVLANKKNYFIYKREGSLAHTYSDFDTELRTYLLWKETYRDFISKSKQYSNNEEVIWDNTKDAFRRTITSLFEGKKHYSLTEKKKKLQLIPTEDYKLFQQYYTTQSFTQSIDKWILSHRFFTLYSIIRTLVK